MAVSRSPRSCGGHEIVMTACPYCGADMSEQKSIATHLTGRDPCPNVPTTDAVEQRGKA